MTSNRKALFFDIDGTLLSEVNRNVPESARKAVAGARAAGHLVFINSGRTYSLIGRSGTWLKWTAIAADAARG